MNDATDFAVDAGIAVLLRALKTKAKSAKFLEHYKPALIKLRDALLDLFPVE